MHSTDRPLSEQAWRVLSAVVALAVLAPRLSEAQLWRHSFGDGFATDVAVRAGEVVVTGAVAGGMGQAVKLEAATGATVWQRDVGGDYYSGVAIDSAGGAFVSGVVAHSSLDFLVAKLAAGDGTVVWRYELAGNANSNEGAWDVAVNSAGDVVAGGHIQTNTGAAFTVVKLSGIDGSELWRYTAPASGAAVRVAIDAAGDVIAAGNYSTSPVTVVKLAGATGAELWRVTPALFFGDFNAFKLGLAVDGADDVIAVGRSAASDGDLVAIKLSGAFGAEVWRTAIDGAQHGDDFGEDVAVDAAGDVVAAGSTDETSPTQTDFLVVKLAGATGAEVWRQSVAGRGRFYDYAHRVMIDAAGDVLAAGTLTEDSPITGKRGGDLAVVKLAGSTGAILWLQQVYGHAPVGSAHLAEDAAALALDAVGNPIAAGLLAEGSASFGVAKFDGATGGDFLLSGKRLRVRDGDGVPARRSIDVKSSDPRLAGTPVGAVADPTVNGGVLELVNPGTGETASLALPAAGWSALGTPPGSLGYRYEDAQQAFGPCTKVSVEPKRMTARCTGAGISFSLDEPTQGSLGLRITTGPGALRRCVLFGGTVRRDHPSGGGIGGLFLAKGAPPPVTCP